MQALLLRNQKATRNTTNITECSGPVLPNESEPLLNPLILDRMHHLKAVIPRPKTEQHRDIRQHPLQLLHEGSGANGGDLMIRDPSALLTLLPFFRVKIRHE